MESDGNDPAVIARQFVTGRGVGTLAHAVQLENLYDPASKLIEYPGDANEFESAVLDAGNSGRRLVLEFLSVDVRRDPIHTSACAGRFRPPPRIGIRLSYWNSYQPAISFFRNIHALQDFIGQVTGLTQQSDGASTDE